MAFVWPDWDREKAIEYCHLCRGKKLCMGIIITPTNESIDLDSINDPAAKKAWMCKECSKGVFYRELG